MERIRAEKVKADGLIAELTGDDLDMDALIRDERVGRGLPGPKVATGARGAGGHGQGEGSKGGKGVLGKALGLDPRVASGAGDLGP